MRHIVILLMALMSATYIYAQQTSESAPQKISSALILGDVDSDGRLSITDVTMLVNYCIGIQPAGFNKAVAGLNNDHDITVTDVIILVNLVIGQGQVQPIIDNENPSIPVNPDGGDPGEGV